MRQRVKRSLGYPGIPLQHNGCLLPPLSLQGKKNSLTMRNSFKFCFVPLPSREEKKGKPGSHPLSSTHSKGSVLHSSEGRGVHPSKRCSSGPPRPTRGKGGKESAARQITFRTRAGGGPGFLHVQVNLDIVAKGGERKGISNTSSGGRNRRSVPACSTRHAVGRKGKRKLMGDRGHQNWRLPERLRKKGKKIPGQYHFSDQASISSPRPKRREKKKEKTRGICLRRSSAAITQRR